MSMHKEKLSAKILLLSFFNLGPVTANKFYGILIKALEKIRLFNPEETYEKLNVKEKTESDKYDRFDNYPFNGANSSFSSQDKNLKKNQSGYKKHKKV